LLLGLVDVEAVPGLLCACLYFILVFYELVEGSLSSLLEESELIEAFFYWRSFRILILSSFRLFMLVLL
jgi:hypothetical protein